MYIYTHTPEKCCIRKYKLLQVCHKCMRSLREASCLHHMSDVYAYMYMYVCKPLRSLILAYAQLHNTYTHTSNMYAYIYIYIYIYIWYTYLHIATLSKHGSCKLALNANSSGVSESLDGGAFKGRNVCVLYAYIYVFMYCFQHLQAFQSPWTEVRSRAAMSVLCICIYVCVGMYGTFSSFHIEHTCPYICVFVCTWSSLAQSLVINWWSYKQAVHIYVHCGASLCHIRTTHK
jgi:hypothetical protein